MRASDRNLYDALMDVGFTDLANRAADGEWNDYFGKHPMNITHLIGTLIQRKQDFPMKSDSIEDVIALAKSGHFDGTREEADEWAASPEGIETFKELMK